MLAAFNYDDYNNVSEQSEILFFGNSQPTHISSAYMWSYFSSFAFDH